MWQSILSYLGGGGGGGDMSVGNGFGASSGGKFNDNPAVTGVTPDPSPAPSAGGNSFLNNLVGGGQKPPQNAPMGGGGGGGQMNWGSQPNGPQKGLSWL